MKDTVPGNEIIIFHNFFIQILFPFSVMSPDPELNVHLDYIFDQNLLKCYNFYAQFYHDNFQFFDKTVKTRIHWEWTKRSGIKEPHQNEKEEALEGQQEDLEW